MFKVWRSFHPSLCVSLSHVLLHGITPSNQGLWDSVSGDQVDLAELKNAAGILRSSNKAAGCSLAWRWANTLGSAPEEAHFLPRAALPFISPCPRHRGLRLMWHGSKKYPTMWQAEFYLLCSCVRTVPPRGFFVLCPGLFRLAVFVPLPVSQPLPCCQGTVDEISWLMDYTAICFFPVFFRKNFKCVKRQKKISIEHYEALVKFCNSFKCLAYGLFTNSFYYF